nr:nonribosomal peptide synthetase vlms [Quercus suber]
MVEGRHGVDLDTVRKMLSDVLCMPLREVHRQTSFLDLGGDSMTALEFSARCSTMNMRVQVGDILECASLDDLATRMAYRTENLTDSVVRPWTLVQNVDRDRLRKEAREQCGLLGDGDQISDMYPATALQEGLMALAVKQPGSYISEYQFALTDAADVDRFKAAWQQVFRACPILRTRIVQIGGRFWQAVVTEDVEWETSLKDSEDVGYGSKLCHFALHVQGAKHYFHLKMHHAIFDGWCLGLLSETLAQCYYNQTPPERSLVPFTNFVDYSLKLDTQGSQDYWKAQLRTAKRTVFPSRRQIRSAQSSSGSSSLRHRIKFSHRPQSITMATVLRAAWAIVLAAYDDRADDVTFGSTVVGRQVPVDGIEHVAGPVISTVSVRVRLDREQSVGQFLQGLQVQASQMIAFEQLGLQNIAKLSQDAQQACEFSTLLVIQPYGIWTRANNSLLTLEETALVSYDVNNAKYFNYPLVVQGHLHDEEVILYITHDTSVISTERVRRMAMQYEQVVEQLLESSDRPLGMLSPAGTSDLEQAVEWNGAPTEPVSSCVHQLVEAQAKHCGEAPAIQAWDGEFTYGQLNTAANRLAHLLVDEFAVGVGDLVHVCFEKSAWFFVAMLAINKAGAAWVPLDPSHPSQRLQQVVQQTGAKLALTSPEQSSKCADLVAQVVEVTAELDQQLVAQGRSDVSGPTCEVGSGHAAYVLFTSGSTGTPKGLVMEHGAVCTSQRAIGERLGLTSEVRMLQFAAFVFDLSIGEIVGPLIAGACICVPSEHTRMNGLKEFMVEKAINWAFLTPAFARTMSPDDVPGLELLLLAGEAVGQDVFDRWFGRVRLINGWGPAETCVFSTLHEWQSAGESPLTVGRPVGGWCWIVDPEEPQQLAPIGCLGEVVIQGPTLLREYLADPERTAASMTSALPEWAPRRETASWGRFFRSGDLCSYNPDGTIEFSSRKDTQVKIRGLRVELGEVEHHTRAALNGVRQVVVDVFKTEAGSTLAAFFAFNDETRTVSSEAKADSAHVFLPITPELRRQITAAAGELSVVLPSYMVPTLFVPCQYMPSITSTKLDRNGLKRLAATLDQQQVAHYALQDGEKNAPVTELEKRLQEVWAGVLHLPDEAIGRDDSFLRIGGDSISAIQMVTAAREAGLAVTVKDVFDDPRLSSVAACAVEIGDDNVTHEIEPFSLLPVDEVGTIKTQLREQCMLSEGQTIEDAYPCTGLQEGLMALAVKQPGSYMAKYVYQVPAHVDLARLTTAWERTVEACGNLRTRIVTVHGTATQALVSGDIVWEPVDGVSLRSFMTSAAEVRMSYGSRLCRYGLVEESSGERFLVLIIHHAIFDGWSLNLVMNMLQQMYQDTTPSAVEPYAGFIKYTMSVDFEAANDYWANQLRDAKRATFPPPSSPVQTENLNRIMKTTIPFPRTMDSSITKATILRAAWAVVLARYCDSDDICFASTVSGRHAPVLGVDRMVGPSVATVPVRIRLNSQQGVSTMLREVQTQATEIAEFSSADRELEPHHEDDDPFPADDGFIHHKSDDPSRRVGGCACTILRQRRHLLR